MVSVFPGSVPLSLSQQGLSLDLKHTSWASVTKHLAMGIPLSAFLSAGLQGVVLPT